LVLVQQFLCPRLVGRERELAVVHDVLVRGRDGCGSVVLVMGGAGIGKSRFVQEVADQAAGAGLVVLRGRATMAVNPEPYRPLAEALAAGVRASGPPETPELAPYRPFLGRLLPQWRVSDPVEDSIAMVGEAVVRLLAVLGGDGGCLMILEDLHWSDPETIAIVEYMADHVASAPVVCIVTCRSDDTLTATAALRALVSRRVASPLVLPPLGDQSIREMATACVRGSAMANDAVDALVTAAEGVPFLVEELLAAWEAAGVLSYGTAGWTVDVGATPIASETFSDAVARRIDMLGGDTRSVLEAAAVLGRRFDWPLLAPMTNVDGDDLLQILRRCVDAQLLETVAADGQAFRFRHMLTREAVLGRQLPAERAMLAGRALDVLGAEGGVPAGHAALALELAEMADPQRAAGLLVDLGRDALRRAALETSERAFGRAVALAVDTALRQEATTGLIEVLAAAGKLTRAEDVASSFLAGRFPGDPQEAAIRLSLARAAVAAERWVVAAEHVQRARQHPGGQSEADLDVTAAQIAIGVGEPGEAAALARRALELAELDGRADIACEALQVLGRCERLTDLDEARARFERAVALATQLDLPLHRVRALHEWATIDMLAANDISGLEAARQLAVEAGAPVLTAVLDIQVAGILTTEFRLDDAETYARRAAETARRLELNHLLSIALLWEAHAQAQRGNAAAMESLITEALLVPAPDADALANGGCRALLALVEDDREWALVHLKAGEAAVLRQSAPNPWLFRGLLALLQVVDGHDNAAGRLRSSGATVYWMNGAFLALADAVRAGRAGDRQVANAAFARGDAELARTPWFRHLARRHVAEAALHDDWGEPVAWLRVAAEFFGDEGFERLRVGCRSLLRHAGKPVPRRGRGDSTVPPALLALGVTSREVDVLNILREGFGNTEIGRRLYLSPRTVEKHVANLLLKTGIADRRALAEYANRLRIA
jgi:DNA-binding CsgD family transcriptional regulator